MGRGKTMERKYLRTLSRYLRLPRKTRKRILADLKAEIESRQENGEMIEEILKDLGPEKELAEEFHGNFEEQVFSRNEKAKMFVLTILGALLLALAVFHGITLAAPWLAAKYVLSGMNAQENTQIFMAFRLGARETIIKMGIELTAGLLMLLWAIRRKKKRP